MTGTPAKGRIMNYMSKSLKLLVGISLSDLCMQRLHDCIVRAHEVRLQLDLTISVGIYKASKPTSILYHSTGNSYVLLLLYALKAGVERGQFGFEILGFGLHYMNTHSA
jgi:hypothetical protein